MLHLTSGLVLFRGDGEGGSVGCGGGGGGGTGGGGEDGDGDCVGVVISRANLHYSLRRQRDNCFHGRRETQTVNYRPSENGGRKRSQVSAGRAWARVHECAACVRARLVQEGGCSLASLLFNERLWRWQLRVQPFFYKLSSKQSSLLPLLLLLFSTSLSLQLLQLSLTISQSCFSSDGTQKSGDAAATSCSEVQRP